MTPNTRINMLSAFYSTRWSLVFLEIIRREGAIVPYIISPPKCTTAMQLIRYKLSFYNSITEIIKCSQTGFLRRNSI